MIETELLVNKYNDLTSCSNTHYNLINAGSIIWQLLVENPLVDKINKNEKQKLVFRYKPHNATIKINGRSIKQIATLASFGKVSDGSKTPMSRKKFLNATAFRYGNKDKNVQELIAIYRNAMGGTHTEPKGKNKHDHKNIAKLSELVKINKKNEGYDNIMREVVISVIEALEPLVKKIIDKKQLNSVGSSN